MSTRLALILATLLVPANSLAQPGDDPTSPDNDATTQPAPTPSAPPVVIQDSPPRRAAYATEAPRYETYQESWNRPLFSAGAILFLGSYGASVIIAGQSEDDPIDRGMDRLYIPVAGPWLALNDRPDCGPAALLECDRETWKKALLVVDGIVQAGGVVTMIAGLTQPRETRVLANPTASRSFRVVPTASVGDGPGVVMFGRF